MKESKIMKPKLPLHEAIDLTPTSETVIDLLGRDVPEMFSPFGTCHGTSKADWTPEKGAAWKAEYEAAEKLLAKAKRSDLIAYLARFGIDTFARATRYSLASRALIAVCDARAPKRFVNAAPNDWICGCGYEGPVSYVEIAKGVRVPRCPVTVCARPHYTMVLRASRDWVNRVFDKKAS